MGGLTLNSTSSIGMEKEPDVEEQQGGMDKE